MVITLLTVLPRVAAASEGVRRHLNALRLVLCLSIHVWVTALVTVTGGVRGPFWICYLGVVLFAAVSMTAWQASLFGLTASIGLVIASGLSGTLDRAAVGPLLLIGATFPIVSWFNSTLSAAVWELRRQAEQEHRALEARVDELSVYLERAASGDVGVEVDPAHETQQLQGLSLAFNQHARPAQGHSPGGDARGCPGSALSTLELVEGPAAIVIDNARLAGARTP